MMANSKLLLFVLLALVVGAFGRPLSAEQDPDDNENDEFAKIDRGEVEDGYITPEELVKTRNIPLVFANSYVVAFDKNGDGKLDRGEFSQMPLD